MNLSLLRHEAPTSRIRIQMAPAFILPIVAIEVAYGFQGRVERSLSLLQIAVVDGSGVRTKIRYHYRP